MFSPSSFQNASFQPVSWSGLGVVIPPFSGIGEANPYGPINGTYQARIRFMRPTAGTVARLVDGRVVSGDLVAGVVPAWAGFPAVGSPGLPPGLPTGAVVV